MSLSLVTYALSKKYTDTKVIHVSEDVIEEAVRQSKEYTDLVATQIEWKKAIVQTLPPAQEADEHTIYFVPASEHPENDGYFEYMVIDNKWEVIGRTIVDMSDYYTKEEVEDYVLHNVPIASSTDRGGVIIDDSTINVDNDGRISISTISNASIEALFS